MKHYLLLCIILLAVACGEESSTEEKRVNKLDSMQTVHTVVTEQDTVIPEACPFDSVRFRQKMGKGLFQITLRPYNYRKDSLVFEAEGKEYVMRLIDNPGWELTIEDAPFTSYMQPFAWSDFAHHFQFIWMQGTKPGEITVKSMGEDRYYRVLSDTLFFLMTWDAYLLHNFVAMKGSYDVHERPGIESKIVEDAPDGFFRVSGVKDEWIQLVYLDPTDPSLEKKRDTIGWSKWYCNDSIRVEFLNDIHMESYYLDAH